MPERDPNPYADAEAALHVFVEQNFCAFVEQAFAPTDVGEMPARIGGSVPAETLGMGGGLSATLRFNPRPEPTGFALSLRHAHSLELRTDRTAQTLARSQLFAIEDGRLVRYCLPQGETFPPLPGNHTAATIVEPNTAVLLISAFAEPSIAERRRLLETVMQQLTKSEVVQLVMLAERKAETLPFAAWAGSQAMPRPAPASSTPDWIETLRPRGNLTRV